MPHQRSLFALSLLPSLTSPTPLAHHMHTQIQEEILNSKESTKAKAARAPQREMKDQENNEEKNVRIQVYFCVSKQSA